jgi:1-acyl-sn-glycerol-3-phosphate acyltransferase
MDVLRVRAAHASLPVSEMTDPPVDSQEMSELHEALGSLRREIVERFPAPEPEVSLLADVDWEALFDGVRRRLSSIGMSERSGEVDEFGMDEIVVRRARRALDLLYDRYWRVDLDGVAHLPAAAPALLVANRSGMVPWDGLVLAHGLHREHPDQPQARFLVADWLITLPFVQPYLARLGGVRACRENAERLLASKQFVIAFPEGAKGATKVMRERYQLQRFGRGGVVRLALETGVPLVPVGIVGAEEANPILFKWHMPARRIGLPFLPVTPTFPLLGPLGLVPLPSKWVVRIGEPLAIEHLDPDAANDELLISRLTEELRARIHGLVEIGLGERESVWG